MDSNVPIKDAFKMADDVLRQGVRGISEIITVSTAVVLRANNVLCFGELAAHCNSPRHPRRLKSCHMGHKLH
jgi:hypothetical protein